MKSLPDRIEKKSTPSPQGMRPCSPHALHTPSTHVRVTKGAAHATPSVQHRSPSRPHGGNGTHISLGGPLRTGASNLGTKPSLHGLGPAASQIQPYAKKNHSTEAFSRCNPVNTRIVYRQLQWRFVVWWQDARNEEAGAFQNAVHWKMQCTGECVPLQRTS
jgi:hypothetical protein